METMEIFDNPLGPVEVIELDELPAGLEVSDIVQELLPGSAVPPPSKEEEKKETNWEKDGDHAKFLLYLKDRLSKIPTHSGQTSVGCEKAISFLRKLDREISKAIQSDEKNVIDEAEAEGLRDTILDFINQLEDAHGKIMEKKKTNKKASVWVGKEVVARLHDGHDIKYYIPVVRDEVEELLPVTVAEPDDEQVQMFVAGEDLDAEKIKKEAHTARLMVYVDPFMQAITRILINSHVSAGRNIEEVYKHLKKKYAFQPREELGIQEILLQKGLPIFTDFGRIGEDGADYHDGKGIEFSTTYPP